ncbi:hypothetical protein, variant [Puccinia graminis f. sp. tritici CRL 75-36-700-3]|uniref:NADP-dependent oxidoreductase domain-containing protein n=1 Tax=Puccinia graminis f. sp. tritici (strain CRL 75-36-700-3 / race SCCL) TaxID=418459 RepID=E3L0Z4_PUCGT|nr:uncharacterized protein PGTG_16497 [Puccinia graminis f. sp. tritici CRL 75-36-700-3]XP_003888953.1 hypothetical protein, variant [Puccinia graminis f. sp. tritici CRL 75-36-700-3]EFP90219.2 hypothetical protein PGTG_16497 [Puccinia graminis f. sp. tritici CRL 75-36-700-3]EHS64465.1 hypothetical protein, variant [Puccinia graminis f. sp. tritici CRL 75-36-700-3]
MAHLAIDSLQSSAPSLMTNFAAPLTIESRVSLNSGHRMPILGFGTWKLERAEEACSEAIKIGYRHLDSARIYRTEADVSNAVQKSTEDRGSMFLTTKVRRNEHGYESCKKALLDSITAPKPEYWDLVLLHDPLSGPEARHEAYRALAEAQQAGKVKSIGVSNFGVDHLEKLQEADVGPTPAVNQLELHPWCQQTSIVEYCRSKGIIVQAYSPLARGQYFSDDTVVKIASKVRKTPAQVLLRWSLQKGFVPLPKSSSPERMKENASIFDFELEDQDMIELDSLNKDDKGSVTWTPCFKGVK